MGVSIRKAVWIGAALLLVGLAGVSAQMMGPGMMNPGDGMMGPSMMSPGFGMMGQSYGMMGYDPIDRMRVALNLSDDQVAQLRNLWLEYVRSTAQGQANLQTAQAELQVLLQAGKNANPGQVENQIRQISTHWANLQVAGIRYQQQLRNVLTPQQLDRFSMGMRWGPFWYDGPNNGALGSGSQQQGQQPGMNPQGLNQQGQR